jgi:hypothetical protein
MNDENRYAPPKAPVADRASAPDTTDGRFIENGRTVSAGNGVQWISQSWQFFKQQPLKWIVFVVVFILALWLPSRVPFGSIGLGVVAPILYGGLMFAIDQQRKTGNFEFGHLLAGFQQKAAPLLGLGLFSLLTSLISVAILAAYAGTDMMAAFIGGDPDKARAAALSGAYFKTLLVYLPISYVLYTFLLYSPALVMLHDVPPVSALKQSFIGAWRNFFAGLIFLIVLWLLVFASAIPIGLGLFVTVPMAMICFYTSYRDIFIET